MNSFLSHSVIFGLFFVTMVHGNSPKRAAWMSGNWGIGYRITASEFYWNLYNVTAFIDQLKTIRGNPSHVIVNLSGPAHGGDVYNSHNPVLWSIGNYRASPSLKNETEYDFFQDLIDEIHKLDMKVIIYMAGQGPALLKLTAQSINRNDTTTLKHAHDWNSTSEESPARNRWLDYVANAYDCDPLANNFACAKEAYAQDIVHYYSTHFGTDIDGWWFDQGNFIDATLVEAACRAGNPDAVVALNRGTKIPLQVNNVGLEDYTFGHPNPIKFTASSDDINEEMVTSIEATTDGYLTDTASGWEALGHMFMPMGTTWNGILNIYNPWIKNEWTEERAINWKTRVLQSGGSWTWNLPIAGWPDDPDIRRMSILREDFVDFLNNVTDQIFAPSAVPSQSPSVTPRPTSSTTPSQKPSASPSQSPSLYPSESQSVEPSTIPTQLPSNAPSETPSAELSTYPSETPSVEPSTFPTTALSDRPSEIQTVAPSTQPSVSPSTQPSSEPSAQPSAKPSVTPSITDDDGPLDCSSHQCGNGNQEKWKVCKVRHTGENVSKCRKPGSSLFDGGQKKHYCGACERLDCSSHQCGNGNQEKWKVCKVRQTGVEVSKCRKPDSSLFDGEDQEHYCGACVPVEPEPLDCSSHQCGNGNQEKWEVCKVRHTGDDVSTCRKPDSSLFNGGGKKHYCGACEL